MAHLTRQRIRLNCQGSVNSSCSSTSGRRTFYQSSIRQSAEPDPTSLTSSTQQSVTSEEQGQHHSALNAPSSSFASPRRGSNILPPYPVWRKTVGKSFEYAAPGSKGPFWIGETPFPLNPSFNPPAPIAHSVKQDIWQLHSTDPQKNNVRKLSTQFGIPTERVVAILRLMALEKEFKQQGKALQTPFQRQMERLLGSDASRSASVQKELDALNTKASGSMAGQTYEEFGGGAKESQEASTFAPALRKEADERRERIRKMATGGPASKGSELSSIHVEGRKVIEGDSVHKRTSITFVDMSSRPTSYLGAGRLLRNVKRADQRKANRDKRRAQDEKWTLRTELAKKIEQGDRSPETLAQKAKLDEERVKEIQLKEAEWRKKYKSNRKRKMAMKILNGQAPKPRRK